MEVMCISHWKCFPKLLHLRCVCSEGREETSPFVILPIPLEPTRVLESTHTQTQHQPNTTRHVCVQNLSSSQVFSVWPNMRASHVCTSEGAAAGGGVAGGGEAGGGGQEGRPQTRTT